VRVRGERLNGEKEDKKKKMVEGKGNRKNRMKGSGIRG